MPVQTKSKPQSQPETKTTQAPSASQFPDPNKPVKLPRKPFWAMARDWLFGFFEAVFSSGFEAFVGFGLAFGAIALSVAGYYATLINPIFTALGYGGFAFFGVKVLPLLLAIAKTLTIQWREIAPKKYEIFTQAADRAAFKAGKEVMVNPKETPDKPSMLPTFKYMARNGDSMKHRAGKRDRTLCYVYEAVGVLTAIGIYLGSMNPMIQIGAIFFGIYAVFGCEYGLNMAQAAREQLLTAEQERDYRVEKARIQENA